MYSHQIVAQLAGSLRRPVYLLPCDELPTGSTLATSRRERGAGALRAVPPQLDDEADEIRTAIDHLRSGDRRTSSMRVRSRGGRERILISLTAGGDLLGYLWIDNDGKPALTAAEFSLITSTAAVLQSARADGATSSGTRDGVMSRLLDENPLARTAALQTARSHRWLDPHGVVTLRAVAFDHRVDELQRVAFGRHLAGMTRAHSSFLGAVDGAVIMATSVNRCALDLDAVIASEAARRGLAIVGVGTASLAPGTDDPWPAVDEALTAAELRATLGDAIEGESGSDIGAWMLLHAVTGSHRLIERASPAAEALWRASDPLQRMTVEAYLDAGGQVAVACKRLHVHRTTLYYRLDNMPPVVRDALADGLKRSTLHLALKLLTLWESPGAEDRRPATVTATDAPRRLSERPRARPSGPRAASA